MLLLQEDGSRIITGYLRTPIREFEHNREWGVFQPYELAMEEFEFTLIAGVPSQPDDFSMFSTNSPPMVGQYQATDGNYIYYYKAGWQEWLRAPIAVW